MEEICSKISPEKTICIIKRKNDAKDGRQDLTKDHEVLQVSLCNVNEGIVAKPHAHLLQSRTTEKTQESMVVVKGKMESTVYDLDHKTILGKFELEEGDCFIALNGGHSHKALKNNTLFYEFKNGPYYGPEKDRKLIQNDS